MDEVAFTLNGQKVKGNTGDSIIDVAQNYGIPIPTLCHDPCLESIGACRVCLVEDEKREKLVPACVTPIAPKMSIKTDSQMVLETRKVVVKLLLASHPESCIVCEKGNQCKLRQIAADLGIGLIDYYPMPHFSGTHELNPFISRDISKCILCAKCIRADHELVAEGAIDYIDRGFEARPATLTDGPLETSECTFCGTCVEMCPTGALFEKNKHHRGSTTKRVATTCSFCGCGCSFYLKVSNNQVVGVQPGISGSVNGPTLCAKGHFGYEFINHPERLKKPLIKNDDGLNEASWDDALKAASDAFKNIKNENGGQSIAIIAGPHCTNEEAFLLNKIAKDVIDTPNISSSSNSYMSNLIMGMEESLDFVGSNITIEELKDAEAILLVGANPTETAPIVGYNIKRGVKQKNTRLIVIDPVEIKLTKYATHWLRPSIGTDEILLMGFLSFILENSNFTKSLSGNNLKKIKAIKNQLKDFSFDVLEKRTGISLKCLKEAAETFCTAEKRVIVFGNGIIQQSVGKDLIKILCTIGYTIGILTNNKTSILPIIKQSNALGLFHTGLINATPPEKIFTEINNGNIKGLWIIGDDPIINLPGIKDVEKALEKLEFLVVSDTFLNSSAQKADVVLPSSSFAEKSGTITNMEGRVQEIRAAIDCVGESRPDWSVICDMANYLGTSFKFKSEKSITKEIITSLSLFEKMDIPAKDKVHLSYRLPVNGKEIKSFFVPENIPDLSKKDKEYPYTIMLGGILFQLGSGYQTRYSTKLCRITEDEYVEINPEDASKEDIKDSELIKLVSAEGEKTINTRVTSKVPKGTLFLPLPFIQNSNLFAHSKDTDVHGKTCRIKIERIKT